MTNRVEAEEGDDHENHHCSITHGVIARCRETTEYLQLIQDMTADDEVPFPLIGLILMILHDGMEIGYKIAEARQKVEHESGI